MQCNLTFAKTPQTIAMECDKYRTFMEYDKISYLFINFYKQT